MTKIWDQQIDESSKAFEAFCTYRDMGIGRSLRKLSKMTNCHLSTLGEHSKKYDWQSRVIAWDAHLDKISQHNQSAELKEMKRRQIELAIRAQEAAAKGLELFLAELTKNPKLICKPEGLAKLLDSGCRLESLNRDEPEQSLEISHHQDFDRLEEAELETMRYLIAKAQGSA
jgi:hypothetical protein